MFVKATSEPLEVLFSLVNAAYGKTAAHKQGPRYHQLKDAAEHVGDTWLWRDDDSGEVTGCVRVRVKDGVAHIGPVAVRPDQKRKGLGKQLMAFGESMAPMAEITVVSCRSDLFPWYEKQGYEKVKSVPITDVIPEELVKRKDLQMITMRKKCKGQNKC